MARRLHRRLLLEGRLIAQEPIHLGGADEGIEVDRPFATDGESRPYVPGTSLAGALKSWMRVALDDQFPARWWGSLDGASAFVVEDAKLTAADGAAPEVWHGVGLDDRWGTASPGIKFELEIMPKGTMLDLKLHLDVVDEADLDRARATLWCLIEALEDARVGLGAAGTRGLGRVRLPRECLACYEQDWSSRDGVLAVLADSYRQQDKRGEWQSTAERLSAEGSFAPRPLPTVEITVQWQPAGPLMVKAPRDGLAVDALPMLSADGTRLTMVLPGSSIKGTLRSQAERIVRTVLDLSTLPGERHHEQGDLPLLREVFGNARPPGSKRDAPRGRRGALAVDTCYAVNTQRDRARWNAVANTPGRQIGSPLVAEFANQGLPLEHVFHVAVDRWTGGAADGLLYSAIEPLDVQWEPLRLQLDLRQLDASGAAAALLLFTLRDLWEQNVTLGFGANRGYGAVEVKNVTITGLRHVLGTCDGDVVRIEVAGRRGNLTALDNCLECLERAWESWIAGVKFGANQDASG